MEKGGRAGERGKGGFERRGGNKNVEIAQWPGRGEITVRDVKGSGTLLRKAPCNS